MFERLLKHPSKPVERACIESTLYHSMAAGVSFVTQNAAWNSSAGNRNSQYPPPDR